METRLAALETELEGLRAAQRRFRRGFAAAAAAALGLVALGMARAEDGVVEARRVVLRDAEGRTRASLSLGEKGEPSLALLDAQGEERARLALDAAGVPDLRMRSVAGFGEVSVGCAYFGQPAVMVKDGKGAVRALLGAYADGSAGLNLLVPGAREMLRAMTTAKEAVLLSLFDGKRKERLGMSVLERGSVGLLMSDGKGETRASLVVESDDLPSLRLKDAGGKTRMEMEVRADGGAGVGCRDPQGRLRASLGTTAAGDSGVNTFDATGAVGITLAARAGGAMNLAFSSGGARPLAELGVGPLAKGGGNASFLALRGSGDRERVQLQAHEGGPAVLKVLDSAGRERVVLGESGGEQDPALALFDAGGRLLHQAPPSVR